MRRDLLVGAAMLLACAACKGQPDKPGAVAPTGEQAGATAISDAPLTPDKPAPDMPAPEVASPATPPASGSTPAAPPPKTSGSSPSPGAPATPPPAAGAGPFSFGANGKLVAGSGAGAADQTIWAPNMRFPIESTPAFANSQVYGVGGSNGPAGTGQCDPRNYSYPWHDNFCESRGYTNIFCASGKGHQGQDIRPGACKKAQYWAVAAEDGTITGIGTYTVFLTATSGRLFRYLHMDMAKVHQMLHVGQELKQGDRIGLVSNNFGSTATTIHLHFEIKAPVTRDGKTVFTFVPPYPSLVPAYQRLIAAGGGPH